MGMENKAKGLNSVEKSTAEKIEEEKWLFARLLLSSREALKKTRLKIANEINLKVPAAQIKIPTIQGWEGGKPFPVFPDEKMLEAISQVYGIDKEELKRVFTISTLARDKEKSSRISIRKDKPKNYN
jgi:transcriptional regulator with XRE-family HTH domain